MDRFAEKQIQIDRRRADVSSRYPELWSNIIAEWTSSGTEDRVWLTYSANYLFRTNNVHWAMDPLTLSWRIKDAPKVDIAADLKKLSFVLFTHQHHDHLDLDLLSSLRHQPIQWVVPEFLLRVVIDKAGLSPRNIIVPRHLESIELNGVQILPFNGLHWEITPDKRKTGVPALGYLIEMKGKRFLFPGDIRKYAAHQLPTFGPVDLLFAHLWLGRGCALLQEPPLLDAFCQFCLDLKPQHLVLAHLNEFGRDANDLWDGTHVRQVCSRFQTSSPGIQVIPVQIGESILL